MKPKQTAKMNGIVIGILSGDSLIVRFPSLERKDQIQIVCLEHLIAPKFGSPDGQIRDEPYGFESWNFMRKLTIGKNISVIPQQRKSDLNRSHPSFGKLSVYFGKISLLDGPENNDIGLTCVKAGWVKIRSPRQRDEYILSLFAGESDAKKAGVGIWRNEGTVRKLPVSFTPEALIEHGEYEAIVDSVVNGTTLALFLLPKHEHIIFRIAACRSPSAKKDQLTESTEKIYGLEAKDFIISALLHRTITIRVCSCNESDLFIGPILDRTDSAIQNLLLLGLATYNPNTADITPSCYEYERCEAEAKAKRQNLWSEFPQLDQIILTFEGIVRQIIGSCSLRIDVHGQIYLVQFSCIRTNAFIAGGGSMPFGFETRERIRGLLIGNMVKVVVDGVVEGRYYGTVYYEDICINELLCREGMAMLLREPIIGRPSEKYEEYKNAILDATGRKVGIYSSNLIPLMVKDFSQISSSEKAMNQFETLKGQKLIGIVEEIMGGNRFVVLVPEMRIMLRLAVNGLLPITPSDIHAREAMDFSLKHYLNRNVEFDVTEVDKSGGFISNMDILMPNGARTNIAQQLLEAGLAEVHKRTVTQIENFDLLTRAQLYAQSQNFGKWSQVANDHVRLEFSQFYAVKVVEVIDPVTLIIQFLSEAMKDIEANLSLITTPLVQVPSPHDLVCVNLAMKYRGRVESVDSASKTVKLLLIDYDIHVDAPLSTLYELPQELINYPPQALTVNLAFLDIDKVNPKETEYVTQRTQNSVLYLNLVYITDKPAVLMFDRDSLNSGNLNAMILYDTSVKLVNTDIEVGFEFMDIIEDLKRFEQSRFSHPRIGDK